MCVTSGADFFRTSVLGYSLPAQSKYVLRFVPRCARASSAVYCGGVLSVPLLLCLQQSRRITEHAIAAALSLSLRRPRLFHNFHSGTCSTDPLHLELVCAGFSAVFALLLHHLPTHSLHHSHTLPRRRRLSNFATRQGYHVKCYMYLVHAK